LVAALPSVDLQVLPRMFADYKWNLGRTHCPIPYVEPTIDADGNVFPCDLFTDEPISMGNVYEKPFLEI
jgi:MoaA/NifB/PqqE/SkfB family radical SAM enzyme